MTPLPHADLHQTLLDHKFDHAVICTYSFDCTFFESYCLEKFKALYANANVLVLVDRGVYEAQLKEGTARTQLANVRYLMHPVSLSTGGVFHPKLFLFASKDKGLLVVGSANFTEPGLKTNAELIGQYHFELGKREEFLSLFQQAFLFLQKIAQHSPSTFLTSGLEKFAEDAQWLDLDISDAHPLPVRLIHNLDESLWSQFRQDIDAGDTLSVLSPYYDARPELLSHIYKDLAPRHVDLYTQNGTTTLTPEWLLHPAVKQRTTDIHLCTYRHAEHNQYLHAKGMALTHGNSCRLAFGSANFTQAAWLKTARQGNTELLLLFDDVSKRKLSPKTLFDPLESAERLTRTETLKTSASPGGFPNETRLIHLSEVLVKGDELRCNCEVAEDRSQLFTVLWQSEKLLCRLDVFREDDGVYKAALTKDLQQKLEAAATVVCLQGEHLGQSNLSLIINLQRIDGGGSVLRQRQTLDAQRDPARFVALLGEMMQDSNDDELMDFLGTCDIPFQGSAHSSRTPQHIQWQAVGMLKPISARDVRRFQSVHEAAKSFIERHWRRLLRHVDEAEIETFANFIHLMLVIVAVCLAQVERAAVSLDHVTQLMKVDEWSRWRSFLDDYYDYFASLYGCLFDDYLLQFESSGHKSEVESTLKNDNATLRSAIEGMITLRNRIEARRVSLRVETGANKYVPAPYAPATSHLQNTFAEHNWPKYAEELERWTHLLLP